MAAETVSVCICTYRRPEQLAWLLDDLIAQTRRPDEVVVVDNEPAGGGQASVEAARSRQAGVPHSPSPP